MRHDAKIALLLIASSIFLSGASAQNIYRCGNTYSQQVCPGGSPLHASDKRSNEQKAQADQTTERDMRTAQAMTSARLQQEEKDLAANTPSVRPTDIKPGKKKRNRKKFTVTK